MATLAFERAYPLLGGITVAVAAVFWRLAFPTEALNDLLSSSISIGSILAGFLATTKGILMAMPTNSFVSQLKNSGYINDLAKYLHEAILACLLFCIVNIASFFVSTDISASLWIGVGTYAILAFWRVTKIMFLIVKLSQASP